MLGYFLTTLATALGLLVVSLIVPGVHIATFSTAIIAAVVIGLINAFIRPILFILSLPLNFLTLGAFTLIINGFCLSLASKFVQGFTIHGFLAFILAPIILSLTSTFLSNYFAQRVL